MAQSVWALLDEELVEHISINQCSNAKEWIFFLIESLNHSRLVKCVITLWTIWTARRKAIHEEIFQSPFAIYKFIENCNNELNNQGAKTQTRSMMGTPQRLRAPTWIPPI
jgi:hypothetical protein